jgi:atypical dual specificity phosphatase
MKFLSEKEILPAFPKTAHLPHKPNTDKLDKVATPQEVAVVFTGQINVEEKIDGSSCGMVLHDGEPLIRNRDHILRKGYHKKTAAKMQFASVWNWFYDNKNKFECLAELGKYSVFGEWMVAQHGIAYTRLPAWFIAYDLYDYEKRRWVDPVTAAIHLCDAGFAMPVLRYRGTGLDGYAELEKWANLPAEWADEKAEGVYVKAYDADQVTHRFKMVREDFVRGALWHPKVLTKNRLAD